MLERLTRQVRDVRTKGWSFTLRKLFANHVYGCRTSIHLRGPGEVPAFISRRQRRDLELKRYAEGDACRFRRHLADHLRIIPDVLADGAEVWMLLNAGGDAIAFVCVADKPYYDRHVYRHTYVPPPGGFYLFSLMVAPEFRSFGGVGTSLMAAMWPRLRERAGGRLDCLTAINRTNHASLRMMKSMGFRETGQIVHSHRLFHLIRWSVPAEGARAAETAPGPAPAISADTARGGPSS